MAIQKRSEAFSLIPRRKLLALYTALLRCRRMEELAGGARRGSRLTHPAPAVAIVIDLKPGDAVAASGRNLLPGFVHGLAPQTIVADSLQAAMATARVPARGKRRHVAAIFAHGAATSSAAWRNALKAAGAERLPILFVSQAGRARGGMTRRLHPELPAIPVDRDDVVALYRVASEALAHARRGNGPTLIECVPWPLAGPEKGTDAIVKMELYLAQLGIPFEKLKRRAYFARG